jgi:hypothetical protein
MPDNPNDFQPTRYGQPYKPTGIGATLFPQGTDPYLQQIPTRSGFQQGAQILALPYVLERLARGFNAPSIAPAAAEARREFKEQVLPDLMEQFAGGGSQGALLRGIQGAKGDLETRLGALRQQQQFELQKQQQDQLTRFAELGLAPSFQPHITNMPLNGLPETLSSQIEGSEKLAQAGRVAKGLGGEALEKGAEKFNWLTDKAISQIRKYSPKAAKQLRLLKSSIGNIKGKAEQYAKPYTNPTLPPLPVNAEKHRIQADKKLTPVAKKGLDQALLPFMNGTRVSQLNKVFEKRQRGEKHGHDFFDTLQYIKTPAQFDRWVNILIGGIKTDKSRKNNLDKFLQEIGAGHA